MIEKLTELKQKQDAMMREKLIPLSRAVANMLKDLKYEATSNPLLELLFEWDALEQEAHELIKKDIMAFVQAIKDSYKKD